VLPDSFLERFRAAAAASAARDAVEERTVQLGRPPAPPSPGLSPLPQRERGTNGIEKPLAQLKSSFALGKTERKSDDAGDATQPVSHLLAARLLAPPETKSPGGIRDGKTTSPGDQQELDSQQDAALAGPTDQTAIIEGSAPLAPPSAPPRPPAAQEPPDSRPRAQRKALAPHAAAKKAKSQAAKERSGRGYRMAGLLVIVAVLASGVGAFAMLHKKGHGGRNGPSSDQIPASIRNAAGAWVASQVAASDAVACDPVMCRVLQTHGIAASRVRILWPGSESLAGSSVVIATPAVASHFGDRLDSVYAPGIIARFGSGSQQISVRAVAPRGAAAYRSEAAQDLSARKAAGAEMVRPAAGQISTAEQKELAAGQVDSRVIVIVAKIERHPVQVIGFGDAGPGVSRSTAPFRSVDLAITSKASKQTMRAAISSVAAGDRQYLPSHVSTLRLPNGRQVLRIEYAAPSPLGIFGY